MTLDAFPANFRALVIGASGAIGAAFVTHLRSDPNCAQVWALSRESVPAIDFNSEESIAQAASGYAHAAPFDLIINAAGVLHGESFMPEKRLADLNYSQLENIFRINAFGPALCFKHFAPLLSKAHSVMAVISAKVGSIEDNRLGGWYSYRASKAALNMFMKTASIEISRTRPQAIMVSLHPGTVSSNLSRPFRGDEIGRSAEEAAGAMLRVINAVTPTDTGSFFSWTGERLPW